MQKVVFLDRDGVINKDIGYLHLVNDFEFIEGISVALRHFLSLGYKLIIITNQSGIGRGYYSVNDFKTLTKWMIEQLSSNGIEILDVLYCPHSPDDNCSCRKPNPGLLLEAKKRHNIEMKCSWIIGDKEDDIKAANSAGITQTVLVKSGQTIDEDKSNAKFILKSIQETLEIIN
jgi:D-glycero-D-manno-heptose 1,7-bisphosphate phosphatase